MTDQPSDTPLSDFAFPSTAKGEVTLHMSCYEQCRDLERRLNVAIRERDELREQLAAADKRNEADVNLLIRTAKQRDEARAALREAIQFRDRNLSGYDLAAWRKAAGMEEPK